MILKMFPNWYFKVTKIYRFIAEISFEIRCPSPDSNGKIWAGNLEHLLG